LNYERQIKHRKEDMKEKCDTLVTECQNYNACVVVSGHFKQTLGCLKRTYTQSFSNWVYTNSPDIIRQIKSRRMRWEGHVARMGEERKVYKFLVGKSEGKRPLGRPRRRWEDGIRMDLREIGFCGVDWIRLAQDRDRWRAVVSAVMNLRVLAPRS
jgi:hypothetical protein